MTRPPRAFEDLSIGEKRLSAEKMVTKDEIIAFAKQYDPQWFHSDVDAARESHFGDVIASGIHVLALWRQLDHEINGDIDYVCGIGFDELRLKTALRPGDRVFVTSEITELTASKTGKERGTATTFYTMINQAGDIIVSFTSINLVYTRRARPLS
ncbi:MAG: MaoC/PaaZ C-terminal domain-containing protein [Sphingomonas sp.]